ncbi:MAG: D-2-hydroxyacid dehydrogenase [Peptostreptococcus sp.]|uniref:D-2-hydroxyacid dehydrogenase n=1 Tax=Peptostreptococcus sp. TaxID=1262 RepID=UPI002FC8308C
MKILAYHVQEYEVDAVKNWAENNDVQVDIEYGLLTVDSVDKAKGYDGVTTQQVIPVKDEEIYIKLKENGIKQISSRTAGVDMFDLELAKKHGINVTNVPRYSPNAIAELAVTHAMMLLRNINHIKSAQAQGNFKWEKRVISKEIRNCVVGIIGTGRIGLTAATLFKGLGAEVIGYDVFKNPDAEGVLEYAPDLETLLSRSDVVSLHLPLTEDTYHLINKDNIKYMKEGAILVNTGRGALVDVDAVLAELDSGHLKAAGLDVLECETLYVNQEVEKEKLNDSPVPNLMTRDDVNLTGHFAFFTETAVDNMVCTSLDNIKLQNETGEVVNSTN